MPIVTPEGVTFELRLAGLGSRFVGALVDSLVQFGALFGLALLAAACGAAVGSDGSGGPGGSGGGGLGNDTASAALAIGAFALVAFLVYWGYFTLFETLWDGRTPGKRAAGLRVVTLAGGPVTFRHCAIRNLVRLVDYLPSAYIVGAVTIMVNKRNQRLGDMAAGTLVVVEPKKGESLPAEAWWRGPSIDPLEVAAWDVSAVTAADVGAVRTFLARAPTLDASTRGRLSREFASRLRPVVAGVPPWLDDEAFLARVVVAKQYRS